VASPAVSCKSLVPLLYGQRHLGRLGQGPSRGGQRQGIGSRRSSWITAGSSAPSPAAAGSPQNDHQGRDDQQRANTTPSAETQDAEDPDNRKPQGWSRYRLAR